MSKRTSDVPTTKSEADNAIEREVARLRAAKAEGSNRQSIRQRITNDSMNQIVIKIGSIVLYVILLVACGYALVSRTPQALFDLLNGISRVTLGGLVALLFIRTFIWGWKNEQEIFHQKQREGGTFFVGSGCVIPIAIITLLTYPILLAIEHTPQYSTGYLIWFALLTMVSLIPGLGGLLMQDKLPLASRIGQGAWIIPYAVFSGLWAVMLGQGTLIFLNGSNEVGWKILVGILDPLYILACLLIPFGITAWWAEAEVDKHRQQSVFPPVANTATSQPSVTLGESGPVAQPKVIVAPEPTKQVPNTAGEQKYNQEVKEADDAIEREVARLRASRTARTDRTEPQPPVTLGGAAPDVLPEVLLVPGPTTPVPSSPIPKANTSTSDVPVREIRLLEPAATAVVGAKTPPIAKAKPRNTAVLVLLVVALLATCCVMLICAGTLALLLPTMSNTLLTSAPTVAIVPTPLVQSTPEAPASARCNVKDGNWKSSNDEVFNLPGGSNGWFVTSFTISNCTISELRLDLWSGSTAGGMMNISKNMFFYTNHEIPVKDGHFSYQESQNGGNLSINGSFTSSTQAQGTWALTAGTKSSDARVAIDQDISRQWISGLGATPTPLPSSTVWVQSSPTREVTVPPTKSPTNTSRPTVTKTPTPTRRPP